MWRDSSAQGEHTRGKSLSVRGFHRSGGTAVRLDVAQTQQVRGAAGLRGRSDGRALPPTKGLAAHDSAGDATVDVEVTGLDTLQPRGQLGTIEGVEARRQSVVDLVNGVDCILEGIHAHHAEDGCEVLGQVEFAAGHHARTDTGGPQPITQVPGLEHPVLALPQSRQASHRLLVVGHDDGTDLRVQGRRQADAQRGCRIHKLARNTRGASRRANEDQQ